MQTFTNVHQQFAEFFKSEELKPYAYLVSKRLAEGHICVPLNDAPDLLAQSPYNDKEPVALNRLARNPLVATGENDRRPFVLHHDKLYLQRYFNYETQILERLKAFTQVPASVTEQREKAIRRVGSFIVSLFESNAPAGKEINWQLIAAITGVLNNFTIITGGPGTGKTTTVAKILAILFTIEPHLKVALAAPTGKAAVRMAESLKSASGQMGNKLQALFQDLSPGTIHRLLKYIPQSPFFRHNATNPVPFDVVIIDESSMIDVALFARLLMATGKNTRLILLGDKDQLASVEAGSLFGDLCKTQSSFAELPSKTTALVNTITGNSRHSAINPGSLFSSHPLSGHVVELKKSHRFKDDEGIGRFSRAVINNNIKIIEEFIRTAHDSHVEVDTHYSSELFDDFVMGYKAYITEPDIKAALKKLNDLRVLCAIREGDEGLYKLNQTIENLLKRKKLLDVTTTFYNHKPVIITKNYYQLNLFNGDVGIVRPDGNGVLKVWFEDADKELKAVFPGYIAEAETTFAMTIHKSQGSEYGKVLIVLPANINYPVLTRELLYTAVTRAKTKAIIQAPAEVILHTAATSVKRASGIADRFAR